MKPKAEANIVDSARHAIHEYYKSAAEYFVPVATNSAFNEKGVLTPEEFLAAGNQLVYKCPTWTWEGGDPSRAWNFLPKNQQFLITRGVPSLRRVADLVLEQTEQDVEGGDWLLETTETNGVTEQIGDLEIGDVPDACGVPDPVKQDGSKNAPLIQAVEHEALAADNFDKGNDSDDDFEHIPDIESFNDDDNLVISAPKETANDKKKGPSSSSGAGGSGNKGGIPSQDDAKTSDEPFFKRVEQQDNTIATRTYDVSITYDKYYRVPRVWLRGYDEQQRPLTSKQVMEDISTDHAHKTVTVEAHPHTGVVCASIHPCRHADVMKVFIARMESAKKQLPVDQYLFLFLKFMSAVIPTIDYDFTFGVDG